MPFRFEIEGVKDKEVRKMEEETKKQVWLKERELRQSSLSPFHSSAQDV